MYRLNITFIVAPRVQEQWLSLVGGKFIPALRERGYHKLVLSRVLSAQAEDHFTWSLLIELDSMDGYHDITGPAWDRYAEIAGPMFGEEVMHFTSLLKQHDC